MFANGGGSVMSKWETIEVEAITSYLANYE